MIIKTDWKGSDALTANDVNRIEGNIETNSTIADWPTATGTTSITIDAPHFELKAGKSLTFIAGGNNNSNPTTININGLGAKNLYKANTSEAPLIKTGRAYSVWYDGTDFFVKASAEGDAEVGDVLAGKLFSNDEDTGLVGTMANIGNQQSDISTKTQEVVIQQGFHNGSGRVKISAAEQAKIIANNIKAGVTILGVGGSFNGPLVEVKAVSRINSTTLEITHSIISDKISICGIVQKTGVGSGNTGDCSAFYATKTSGVVYAHLPADYQYVGDYTNFISASFTSGKITLTIMGEWSPALSYLVVITNGE